jgi:hypothetical protein
VRRIRQPGSFQRLSRELLADAFPERSRRWVEEEADSVVEQVNGDEFERESHHAPGEPEAIRVLGTHQERPSRRSVGALIGAGACVLFLLVGLAGLVNIASGPSSVGQRPSTSNTSTGKPPFSTRPTVAPGPPVPTDPRPITSSTTVPPRPTVASASGQILEPSNGSTVEPVVTALGRAANVEERSLWTVVRTAGPAGHVGFEDQGYYAWPNPVDLDSSTNTWRGFVFFGSSNPEHSGLQFEMILVSAPDDVVTEFSESRSSNRPVPWQDVASMVTILARVTVTRV